MCLGQFDTMGVCEGNVDFTLGPISIIRLCIHSESDNWAILSEVNLVLTLNICISPCQVFLFLKNKLYCFFQILIEADNGRWRLGSNTPLRDRKIFYRVSRGRVWFPLALTVEVPVLKTVALWQEAVLLPLLLFLT